MNGKIQVTEHGRADRVLRNSLISGREWLSRASWEWLFDEKRISRGGRFLRAGDTVSAGELIELAFPGELKGLLPAEKPAELIASGADWLFVNKPAGIPTLPQFPWDDYCFANQVAKLILQKGILSLHEFSQLAEPPILEGGLVQRLDNGTSGGILVALSKPRKAEFRKLIKAGEVEKTYLAVTRGVPRGGEHVFYLTEEIAGKKMRASPESGEASARADMKIEVVSEEGEFALARVTTSQGMRHVVRACLAAFGAPIAGDALYGGGEPVLKSYPYHLLHAESVTVPGLGKLSAPAVNGFIESTQSIQLP